MEKWSCYIEFLQYGKGNVIFRTLVGLILLPWFLFCAVVKAFLCVCVLIGSVLVGIAQLWMGLFGFLTFAVTIMQIAGVDMGGGFWKVDSPWLFVGQILCMCVIIFAPELLALLATTSGMTCVELIEKFNIWILYKLS